MHDQTSVSQGRKAITITQPVLKKGKKEQESIGNILKSIHPPANVVYFNSMGRKSDSSQPHKKNLHDSSHHAHPASFENFKMG